MDSFPKNWRERPGRDPEAETRKLKQRLRAITTRYERSLRRRLQARYGIEFLMVLAGSFLVSLALMMLGRW